MQFKIKEAFAKMSKEGAKLPFIYDPETGKPSVTLFFPYASFAIATCSVIALHFKPQILTATWTAIGFWVIGTVLYRLRKLDKAKIDLDDKSIELSSEDNQDKP